LTPWAKFMAADAVTEDGTGATTSTPVGLDAATDGNGAHLLYRNVFGPKTVTALLRYVAAREHNFAPAEVRNRSGRCHRTDPTVRNCYRLADLADFEPLFRARLKRIGVTRSKRSTCSNARSSRKNSRFAPMARAVTSRGMSTLLEASSTSESCLASTTSQQRRAASAAVCCASTASRGHPARPDRDRRSTSCRRPTPWSSSRAGSLTRCCRSRCPRERGAIVDSRSIVGFTAQTRPSMPHRVTASIPTAGGAGTRTPSSGR
jgi:hypothetical protein